jgi:siderophore synthetase component
MKLTKKIALKNLLNAYIKNNTGYEFKIKNGIYYLHIQLPKAGLEIELSYYSLTNRHQFEGPAYLIPDGETEGYAIDFDEVVKRLSSGICANNILDNHGLKFIEQVNTSYNNLNLVFTRLTKQHISLLFEPSVSFKLSEASLLSGHQMHPTPKSCNGFSQDEFIAYYPEFGNQFQMHYFKAASKNAISVSILENNTNDLIKKHFVDGIPLHDEVLIPLHPWQAKYIETLEPIQKMLADQTLVRLGPMGRYFNATSSIRSVYNEKVPYMLKLSLNVMITNSVRMQYERELKRAISVAKFWHADIAISMQNKFPLFHPITDPAFICLHDNGTLIEESAVLFRHNPFMDSDNNATCLAALCQDYPFARGNRFSNIIPLLAKTYKIKEDMAALIWFKQFLTIAVEPLLWLFSHHEIALEAHQQNLLLRLDDNGLPEVTYYRDSQGYYVSDNIVNNASSDMFNDFATGSYQFVSHHFSYYLICNSVLGVINAIGYTRFITEDELIRTVHSFINVKNKQWNRQINTYLNDLLIAKTLPFKDNLATKLHDLDELTAPLAQQSIYTEIVNPFNFN